jgi:hypothetical protein
MAKKNNGIVRFAAVANGHTAGTSGAISLEHYGDAIGVLTLTEAHDLAMSLLAAAESQRLEIGQRDAS